MSQANSDPDIGMFESEDFGSEDFGAVESFDDGGVGFVEGPDAESLAAADAADAQAASGPKANVVYKKEGFTIYTLFLVLSFLMLTTSAIVLFTYAASLE